MEIKTLLPTDWEAVKQIYESGIATGYATLEADVPSWEAWNDNHLPACRIVAKQNDTITGWAALSPVSGRCVYGGVAEVSVYIHESFRGQGVGTMLMQSLVEQSESAGIWTLQSGIFSENKGSIALHEKVGFRIVGTREKLGKLQGIWKDIVLMERRSRIVGL